MGVRRLAEVPGFSIDRVAAAAGEDPDILRLENLDTDLRPTEEAIAATQEAARLDEANSYLPFTGKDELKEAVAQRQHRRSGVSYDPASEVVITCGEGDAMVDALLATTDVGDEVILPDPTYAGMINRVRLVGAVPRLVPLHPEDGEWRMDAEALRAAVSPHTRAVFLGNPEMPSGLVLNDDEWAAVCDLCRERSIWLIYLAWMEAILFDGRPLVHPAAFPEMRDRVITVGSVSMEQRMIGWRIGWIVAPETIMEDLKRVHIYNGLVAGGVAQAGALAALRQPEDDVRTAVEEWERRRDAMLKELDGLPAVRPAGGWSLLVDAEALGVSPADFSSALLQHKVAATPMTAWGQAVAPRFIRFVYSNEPVERIQLLGSRVRAALEGLRLS